MPPITTIPTLLAQAYPLDEEQVLLAFITGFEVMAKLGGGWVPGVGRNLQRRGFHPTSVVGRAGAAAVAAVILQLSPEQVCNALGAAATMFAEIVRYTRQTFPRR